MAKDGWSGHSRQLDEGLLHDGIDERGAAGHDLPRLILFLGSSAGAFPLSGTERWPGGEEPTRRGGRPCVHQPFVDRLDPEVESFKGSGAQQSQVTGFAKEQPRQMPISPVRAGSRCALSAGNSPSPDGRGGP